MECGAADFKVTNVDCVLDHLYEACPQLEAIGLAGWKNLSADNMTLLVERFHHLKRLDLSSVNVRKSIGTLRENM